MEVRVVPLGYNQVACDTAKGIADSITFPPGANLAVITAETQDVRYRDDGTNPTTSVGMPLPKQTALVYSGNLAALVFIAQVAGAKINVLFYKIVG